MAGRVWVVGSLNVDRGWRVARHAGVGETVLGNALDPAPGGKGLNQAVAARRMGADVALVGCVGDDDDGRWLVGLAVEEGIDTAAVTATGDAPTGSALIVIAADGANTVTVDAGANSSLRVDRALGFEVGDVVVAQLEVPGAAVAAAFAEARLAGALTMLNPSPLGVSRSLVPEVDVVVVNQSEAADLAGAPRPAASADAAVTHAEAIAGDGQTVVVTLGADGVVAVGPQAVTVCPGSKVEVLDTTGAGDCFLGVLAAACAGGASVDAALDLANRAAALAVTRVGTVAAMPSAADLSG